MGKLKDLIKKKQAQKEAPPRTSSSLENRKILDYEVNASKKVFKQPKSGLAAKINNSLAQSHPEKFSEVHRIISLPIEHILDKGESEAVSSGLVQAEAFDSGWRLFDTQTSSVMAYRMHGGLLAPIGVGWGKTIITLLLASEAWNKGLDKILILVPSSVYPQLWSKDLPAARKKVVITPQFHGLGKKSMPARLSLAKSGRKGVYIMPYSLLSTRDSNELLQEIKPKFIIADEAHLLKNKNAARTKRVLKYAESSKCEFAALSGTITDKSIRDYWHLMKLCLRKKMPLPLTQVMAADWASVLDSSASPSKKQTGPIKPLVDWARQMFPEETIPFDVSGFRKAYKLRLATTPGVVATSDQEIGTSLMFDNRTVEVHPTRHGDFEKLQNLMRDVQDNWLTPNGDEIEHPFHTYKWMFELTSGFYNELVWPEDEVYAKRKSIPVEMAQMILDKARVHHALSNIYAGLLRQWLEDFSRPGLDTPLLVGSHISKHGHEKVGHELANAWKAMKDADFEGRPDRDSKTIRVCDYKITDAIDWAKSLKGKGGILWYWHKGIGDWLAEHANEAGLDYIHCPAGPVHNETIIDLVNRDKIVIASISAHGTGKNLQHFQEQLFVQWPRNCKICEQVLGRLHRNGQEADTLIVNTNNTIQWDHENFCASLVDALYVHQSTGNRQKLIYADYITLPPIIPPQVLRERGFEGVSMLSGDQMQMMEEKFGEAS